MPIFSSSETASRIKKLQLILLKTDTQLAVFNQSVDLFYFTGSFQPLYLIVPADGTPVLLVRKALERTIAETSGLPVESFTNSKDLAQVLSRYSIPNGSKIGFMLDSVSWSSVERMKQFFPDSETVDLSTEVRYLRMIKSQKEIEMLRSSGKVLAGYPEVIQRSFHPGMTELAASAEIEKYFRLNGMGIINSRQEGLFIGYGVCTGGVNSLCGNKFDGVCAGKGLSEAIPFGATKNPIKENEPGLLDYGFVLDGYHTDMTRMACWGSPAPEAAKALDSMVRIEEALVEKLKPGEVWSSFYELSIHLAKDMGYSDVFMGSGLDQVRFIGHGVGLQLDEPPFLAPKRQELIQEGMAIALEPKVTIPGIGVVGIENTYLVGKNGAEIITNCSKDWIKLG